MKNSVCGFNQRNAVEMGLKGDDLLVLRWLVDFSHSPKMKKKMIDGDVYYWVNYQALLNDLPILDIGKDQLQRRILKRLVGSKVLKHRRVREKGNNGGVFSYYAFGVAYEFLISDSENISNSSKASLPSDESVGTHPTETSEQRPFSYSNPSLKQVNNTPELKMSSGAPLKVFPKEIRDFVSKTYPACFEKIKGYPHPPLTPVQRYRTEQVISEYMKNADDGTDMDALEAAAEYFVKSAKTDGNIRAFAHPKTIEIMLNRI